MADGLDVVAVRVEHVCSVVARVVLALSGRSVVRAARCDRCCVKAPDRSRVVCLKREMHAEGRRAVVADEKLIHPEEAVAFSAELFPERLECRAVEALRRIEVAHAQMYVVESRRYAGRGLSG